MDSVPETDSYSSGLPGLEKPQQRRLWLLSWVLLFDELDALAKERADRSEHGELKRVVTSFLQLLDDFSGNSLVIAATNHPALLDEAVWRRFDEVITFGPPSEEAIVALLELKLRTHRVNAPLG